MDMNWTYDNSCNDVISLITKKTLSRKGRYIKTLIIIPSSREPSPTSSPTKTPPNYNCQLNRYPKLKFFFPELLTNTSDLSFNKI